MYMPKGDIAPWLKYSWYSSALNGVVPTKHVTTLIAVATSTSVV